MNKNLRAWQVYSMDPDGILNVTVMAETGDEAIDIAIEKYPDQLLPLMEIFDACPIEG